jgi:hypothetical protein
VGFVHLEYEISARHASLDIVPNISDAVLLRVLVCEREPQVEPPRLLEQFVEGVIP